MCVRTVFFHVPNFFGLQGIVIMNKSTVVHTHLWSKTGTEVLSHFFLRLFTTCNLVNARIKNSLFKMSVIKVIGRCMFIF